MRRNFISNNKAYIVWYIFYFLFFWGLTYFLIIPLLLYIISFLIAITPIAESFWRVCSGVRPLRLRQEKNRLQPLFDDVYSESASRLKKLPKKINLYIQENMDINAFAFGRRTLVLTRGSIELLSDDCLKGLIAHELGHFANGDTVVSLFTTVCNLPMSLLMKWLTDTKKSFNKIERDNLFVFLLRTVFDFIYYIFKGIEFIGDLIVMHTRRKSEYQADLLALKCGLGMELADVLIQIYQVSVSKPESVKGQLKSTHPHITKRIERLESILYGD